NAGGRVDGVRDGGRGESRNESAGTAGRKRGGRGWENKWRGRGFVDSTHHLDWRTLREDRLTASDFVAMALPGCRAMGTRPAAAAAWHRAIDGRTRVSIYDGRLYPLRGVLARGRVAERDEQRSDEELVAAVKAGDWSAFDTLYHRHKEWAFRLAWRFTGDSNDALDVVQEVFVYVAGKLGTPDFQLRASMTT